MNIPAILRGRSRVGQALRDFQQMRLKNKLRSRRRRKQARATRQAMGQRATHRQGPVMRVHRRAHKSWRRG